VKFIETRQHVQEEAHDHIKAHLARYEVETKGVYIQDVQLPEELVRVLTEREIANQEIETFKKQEEAQRQRVATEAAKGTADMQANLARSQVGVDISGNDAEARQRQADGEATFIERTGRAKGAEVEAVGLARARGYEAQVNAVGQNATAFVNAVGVLADSKHRITPEILGVGGGGGAGGGGTLDALAAALTRFVAEKSAAAPGAPATAAPPRIPAR
jgi:hypothetical protein